MDEIFQRYAKVQRVVGYFFSALMVLSALLAVDDSLIVGFSLAAAGVGTFYATGWLYRQMTDDREPG